MSDWAGHGQEGSGGWWLGGLWMRSHHGLPFPWVHPLGVMGKGRARQGAPGAVYNSSVAPRDRRELGIIGIM